MMMSTNNQGEWPKSFRWQYPYAGGRGEEDIVTFLHENDTDRDAHWVLWNFADCNKERAYANAQWLPTDQHKQKSPPAPSQDDRLQKLLDETRMIAKQAGVRCSQESKNLRLIRCIELLADAVERLAK